MIRLVPISPANMMTYKSVRLRALQDAPTAFASTYAEESKRSDEHWMNRAAEWHRGVKSAGFLAIDDVHDPDHACGIAGGYFPGDGSGPYLISMWVEPAKRRHGVGRQLVEAVCDWARSRAANQIVLEVTTTNHGAVSFYETLGFRRTGITRPYPNDPNLQEHEMIRVLV